MEALGKTQHITGKHVSAIFEWSLIILGVIVLFFSLPFKIYGDGLIRFNALDQLLEHGNLLDVKYSLIGPLFSSPVWLLGKLVKDPVWWCSRFNLIVFVLGLLAFYFITRKSIGSSLMRKFLLILLIGSMFTGHLGAYYGEVLSVIFISLGILLVSFKNSFKGWLLAIIGVANIPASILGFVLVTFKKILSHKKIRYILAPLAVMFLLMFESWIYRGHLFDFGYHQEQGAVTLMPYSGLAGFSFPILLGLVSIIFSFGKGLLFFAPALLLVVKKQLNLIGVRMYETYMLWLLFLLGLILIYAKWWSWYGGWFWGPRFFLFASIPASFALAVSLWRPFSSIKGKFFILIVLCLSMWVGVNGAVFGQASLDICYQHNYAFEFLCWYVPEFSVLWRPFVVMKELTTADIIIILYASFVFIYLALPLILSICRQLVGRYQAIKVKYLNFKEWKL